MSKPSAFMSALKGTALVFLCIMFFSCAGPRLRVPEPEPYEGPVDMEVLKKYRVLHDVSSLRAEVKVKIQRGKKKLGTLKGALLFHEPDYFRLRVYSPFGSTGVDVLHADGLIQAFVPDNGVLYEGLSPARKQNLKYRMEDNEKYYSLYALNTEDWGTRIHASYEYDKKTLLNKKITVYEDGEKFVKMHFKDFLGAVPLRAKFELFSGYTMYLELIDPETGVEISPDFFEPLEHDGLEVLPFDRIINEGR